jgi:predicted  nucleic acid-binding Zn-ribbon protein
MTNEEFDRRIDRMTERQEALDKSLEETNKTLGRLTERQQALAESVEMLNHGFVELSSMVRGNLIAIRELRERDKQYFRALAQLLESWAGNGDQK